MTSLSYTHSNWTLCSMSCDITLHSVKGLSSHYINNRQPISGSLSKVLSKLAVEVRVDGEDETVTEHVHEGYTKETMSISQ